MAVIKRLFHSIGKIVSAPFMGYVWMARCKNLLVENARLSTRTTELTAQVSNIQTSNNAKDEELRARMKRIVFLANQTDQLKKQYGVQEEAAMQMMYERNAIHGYALDMDAQYSDAMAAIDQMVGICEKRSIVVQKAISGLKDTIKSLPCSNRISQKDFQRLSAAFDAIPTAYAPDMIHPMKPVTLSLDASFDVRPTQPIVQA